ARDRLGRATAAFALLGRESLTDRDRPDMSQLYLTGMHNAPYDFIRDRWVYNRCHLIGHQFGGASALDNLITGTHALNHTYMLPWENRVADYIRKTGRHVMYRVTPEYDGDELVCRAVRIDALSCDWRGTLCFSVRCPNVQPGVAIDYATGHTTLADDWAQGGTDAAPRTYVINRKNGRFHLPACEDAAAISRRNRLERFCARGELLGEGRAPCGKCRP
ncbi:MAG: DNA/RNA non-specific endonuclease, partial [Clostridia bacterium]|nr:DNA/RNA non-specific endonuclease [Clostridia bacterium]